MADFTKTISNTLMPQGPGVASLWGTMVWGVDLWGNSKDTRVKVNKYLGNNIGTTNIIYSTSTKKVNNSLIVSSRMNLVNLLDGSGYTYVLQGGATDPDNRIFPSYTSGSNVVPSYTAASQNSTAWVTS